MFPNFLSEYCLKAVYFHKSNSFNIINLKKSESPAFNVEVEVLSLREQYSLVWGIFCVWGARGFFFQYTIWMKEKA